MGANMFNFLRNCWEIQSGRTICIHSSESDSCGCSASLSALTDFVCFFKDILVDVSWYLSVVLVYLSLMLVFLSASVLLINSRLWSEQSILVIVTSAHPSLFSFACKLSCSYEMVGKEVRLSPTLQLFLEQYWFCDFFSPESSRLRPGSWGHRSKSIWICWHTMRNWLLNGKESRSFAAVTWKVAVLFSVTWFRGSASSGTWGPCPWCGW